MKHFIKDMNRLSRNKSVPFSFSNSYASLTCFAACWIVSKLWSFAHVFKSKSTKWIVPDIGKFSSFPLHFKQPKNVATTLSLALVNFFVYNLVSFLDRNTFQWMLNYLQITSYPTVKKCLYVRNFVSCHCGLILWCKCWKFLYSNWKIFFENKNKRRFPTFSKLA